MFKYIILFLLILSNAEALQFAVINITNEASFDYFASLMFWLLIISSPMFMVISLFKHVQKSLKK